MQQSTHPYKTLGGFLVVILTLTLMSAARALYTGVIEFEQDLFIIQLSIRFGQPMWAVYYGLPVAISFVQIALSIVFVVLVVKKNRHILTVLVMSVLVMLLGIVFVIMTRSVDTAYAALPPSEASMATMILGASLAAALLYGVLILFYFCRSVRVRTYMGNADYITKSIFKFVRPPLPAVPDSETDIWMNEDNVFGIPDDGQYADMPEYEEDASAVPGQMDYAAANQQPLIFRPSFGFHGRQYKYPEHYYIKIETTDKPYFSKVIQRNFKQYEIREDVPAEEFGGEGRPFDFVFYKHDECVAAIMAVKKNEEKTKPYLSSKYLAEAAGVPLVTFYMQMPNVEEYVVAHTKEKAGLVD